MQNDIKKITIYLAINNKKLLNLTNLILVLFLAHNLREMAYRSAYF